LSTNSTSYSGIDIQAGGVRADNSIALGGSLSTTTVESAGTLYLNSVSSAGIQGNVNLNGGVVSSVLASSQGTGSILPGAVNIGVSSSGASTGNSGEFLLSDSFANIGRNITLSGALGGTGAINVVGNGYGQSGTLLLSGNSNTYNGTFCVSGGATLQSQAAQGFGNTLGNSSSITLNNGFVIINDNGSSGTGVANTIISSYSSNNVVVNGPGTLTLGNATGANSNTTGNILPFNNVTLNNGTTLTLNTTSGYVMRIGGTFSGGGTLAGNAAVNLTGTLAPGDAPAVLNITNTGFSFAGGTNSAYAPEINPSLGAGWTGSSTTNAGVSYDQINMVAGAGLAINGATLNIRMSGASSLVAGDEFFLVNETIARPGLSARRWISPRIP